jgi:hypothetical protein
MKETIIGPDGLQESIIGPDGREYTCTELDIDGVGREVQVTVSGEPYGFFVELQSGEIVTMGRFPAGEISEDLTAFVLRYRSFHPLRLPATLADRLYP